MERKALWVSRIFGFVVSEVYSPLCSFRLSLLVCLFLLWLIHYGFDLPVAQMLRSVQLQNTN